MLAALVVCDQHPSFEALAARGVPLDAVTAIPECGVVVIARATSPLASRIAALAARAWEARLPVVLVRVFTQEELAASFSWPMHPASVVVDMPFEEIADARSLVTALVDDAKTRSHGALLDRLRGRATATILRVTGDDRPAPFLDALLAAHGAHLLGAVLRPTWHTRLAWADAARDERGVPLLLMDQQHSATTDGLAFLCAPRPAATDVVHLPLTEMLRCDTRRYSPQVPSLSAPRALAASIAALQLVHGRWATTRDLIAVVAEEAHARDVHDGASSAGMGVDEHRGHLAALVMRLFLWPVGHESPAERDADDDANRIREEARVWVERAKTLALRRRHDHTILLTTGRDCGFDTEELAQLGRLLRWETT